MKEIIIKYITNTISEDELKALEKWILIPENKDEFEKMIKIDQQLNKTYITINPNDAYNRTLKKIESKNSKKLSLTKKIIQYAAVILFIVGTSISLSYLLNSENNIYQNEITLKINNEEIKVINDSLNKQIFNSKGNQVAFFKDNVLHFFNNYQNKGSIKLLNEILVPNGRKLKIALIDGTLVNINSGSTIKFPNSFKSKKTREIILEGEAFFNVKKDKKHPFIVSTNDMDIRVLGTRFNVMSYQDDQVSSVSLEEGSIAVKKNSDSLDDEHIIIKPGEKVIAKNNILDIKTTNIEKDIAWTLGKLYFENDRFEDITKKLERHYNIKIINNSTALNDIRYTGTFTTETITDLLNAFSELSEFEYEIDKRKITISKVKY